MSNDFKTFAASGGANVLSQPQYELLATERANGFLAGTAASQQLNKVWRQSSIMAAVLGSLIENITAQSAIDDGTTATLLSNLMAAIMKAGYAVDAGVVNAYTIILSPAPLAYYDGMVVSFSTTNANTSATPTLNVGGLGAVGIKQVGGANISVGHIQAGAVNEVVYRSAGPRFELLSGKFALADGANASGNWPINAADAVDAVNAVNATYATVLNTAKLSVASTATPNIFAVDANTIDYTGTVTCTGFAAAPQAGMTRTLICADASKFTAGAALLISGVLSGKTVTLGAGAVVKVIAVTTTMFQMEYSYTGTFVLRSTSFSPFITTTVNFHSSNGYVDWSFQYFGFQGTSDITSFYLDQIPFSLVPNKSQWTHPIVAYNSGNIETVQHIEIADISNNGGGGPGVGAAYICRGGARTGGWTSSGVKGILTNSIRYSIN